MSDADLVDFTFADLIDAEGGIDGARDRLARAGKRDKAAFVSILHRDIDLSIRELEADRKSHQESNEDMMSRIIVAQLKRAGYSAESDPNDGGHVDIKVESARLNVRWFGESKIHTQYDVTLDGIKQLVTRRANGFDANGGFFIYLYTGNADEVVKELRARLLGDPETRTSRFIDDEGTKWRFTSVHSHESGQDYHARQHVVLMNFSPQDKSAKASAARAKAKSEKREKPKSA